MTQHFFKQKKGSVLIMTLFFVVALMTVIPGIMLHMSRETREIQRYIDQVPLSFAADGVQERAVKLLSDFVLKSGFPLTSGTLTAEGYPVTESDDVLSCGEDFNLFLRNWYTSGTCATGGSSFKNRLKGENLAPILNAVDITNVRIFESDFHEDSQKRKYKVIVDFTQTATAYKMQVAQEFVVNNARFFDFSVFYNNDLEITAGPNFTIQGPMFSNEDIYLMNDRGSTLTLGRSLDFGSNPEQYIMNSAGNIYFYFKRATGPNYFSNIPGYEAALPAYYTNPPGGSELFPDALPGSIGFPSLRSPPYYPPLFYYFKNTASLGYPIDGCASDCPAANVTNTILVESSAGALSTLAPNRPAMQFNFKDHISYKDYIYYSPANSYGGQPGVISVSSAFDPTSTKPLVNPSWASSSFQTSGILKSGVSRKRLPVGDPNHPHGTHALIEPLTDIFPPGHIGSAYASGTNTCAGPSSDSNCDSPETHDAKFQWLATQANGLNLYVDGATASADFRELVNDCPSGPGCLGIIVGAFPSGAGVRVQKFLYDYRLGLISSTGSPVSGTVVDIDIGQLLNHLAELKGGTLDSSRGVLIYVHTYPMRQGTFNNFFKPRFVRLVNGRKLPKHGLTIATNGRLWIQGDYNTFEYDRDIDGTILDTGHYCDASEWQANNCKTPPAAIFSDSFGVLSNQWNNSWGSATTLATRDVTQNVTVNTGLATGYLPSQLEPLYTVPASCEGSNLVNCLAWRNINVPAAGRLGAPSATGGLEAYSIGWNCPDLTYQNGKDGVSSACPYYEDGSGSGLFYLNPKSTAYQNSRVTGSSTTLPACNPTIESGSPPTNPNDCDNVRIPIYADPNSPTAGTSNDIAIRPLAGVSFRTLHPRSVCYNGQCSTSGTGWTCSNGFSPSQQQQCVQQGCGETTCTVCTGVGPYKCPAPSGPDAVWGPVTSVSYSSISYDSTRGHGDLYRPHQSGGLENLINLQEDWAGQTLQFLGTFSAPWTSTELIVANGVTSLLQPKYWGKTPQGQDYYGAPTRDFRFNEDLRIHTPPAAPFVFSVERKKWTAQGK